MGCPLVSSVDKTAAWYLPTADSVVESAVFGPTPVPITKVGNGWLGYIGEVNSEKETDDVVLGMLGLP